MDFNKKISFKDYNYCSLLWICYNKTDNDKTNRWSERWFRTTYYDIWSSFEDLLEKDNFVSMHHKKLRALATDTFKVYTKTSP